MVRTGAKRSRTNGNEPALLRGIILKCTWLHQATRWMRSWRIYLSSPGVATNLSGKVKADLIQCLAQNCDVFAWETKEITGISLMIMEPWLNLSPGIRPVKQKRGTLDPKKIK